MTNRRFDELGGIDIIETGEFDRHVVAADLLDVAALESSDTAGLAEQVRTLPAAEAVIGDRATRAGLFAGSRCAG